MQDKTQETLSQLMDGEWQDIDAADSIRAVADDAQLRDTWARYHLVRDVLRNEPVSVSSSLATAIHEKLKDEDSYSNVASISDGRPVTATEGSTESSSQINPWRARLGSLAIAASVAVATVVGLNFWQGTPQSEPSTQVVDASLPGSNALDGNAQSLATVPGLETPQVSFVGNRGTYWVRSEPGRSAESEKRLNMLLSQHIEHAPSAEWQGMLPYSRLVGYDEVTSD
ncbi:MAG: sigma-E factor negative regulatory protein [Granulosicoccus sp.]|nr:sigma-E factor negative regulatory protein [Granulosicoccus sp.]